MAGIASTERSYSPIFKSRGLADDDKDEVYAERVAEIALEMDMALDYMGEVGKFLEEKKDIQLLGDCEEITQNVVEEHIDIIQKLNEDFLAENLEADR